jgi:hypothetical protein
MDYLTVWYCLYVAMQWNTYYCRTATDRLNSSDLKSSTQNTSEINPISLGWASPLFNFLSLNFVLTCQVEVWGVFYKFLMARIGYCQAFHSLGGCRQAYSKFKCALINQTVSFIKIKTPRQQQELNFKANVGSKSHGALTPASTYPLIG